MSCNHSQLVGKLESSVYLSTYYIEFIEIRKEKEYSLEKCKILGDLFSNINRITLKFMFVVFWCSPFLSSVPSISIRNIWHFKINSRTLRLKYSLGASIHKSSPFDCWAVFVLFHELYDGVTWNNFSQWKIQDWRDRHSKCWWEDSPGWLGDYWQVP